MSIPSIPCLISQGNQDALLTAENDDGYITIVPSAGTPGLQEWIIEHRSENEVTFRHLKFNDTYIGVNEVAENALAVASKTSQVFYLEHQAESNQYQLEIKSRE